MPFLEINHLQKRFAQFTAVEDFNLKANEGEFISFLGPSGCGKTTTLRMVAGFEHPTGGEIIINGSDISRLPANKRNIGMVFQSYALFPNMTVRDNIGFGLRIARQPANVILKRVDEMLGIIHMAEFAHRFPHELSGGQQQRVALARALAIQPQILLLDEPLSALDAKIRISLRQEIRSIQRKLGITTIYVTHDQEEALSISDRIVVMNKGHIEQIGRPVDIYNAPRTRFVASFVGTLNVLEATVNSPTELLLDNYPIRVNKLLADEQIGHAVTLALRPESVRMSVNGGADPNTNQLPGHIEEVSFLGSVVRIRVRLNEQSINLDTFNTPELAAPKIGEAVKVGFVPEAVVVLQDE
jgi:putative spermidine/putrescine transport system ATP-binding protein